MSIITVCCRYHTTHSPRQRPVWQNTAKAPSAQDKGKAKATVAVGHSTRPRNRHAPLPNISDLDDSQGSDFEPSAEEQDEEDDEDEDGEAKDEDDAPNALVDNEIDELEWMDVIKRRAERDRAYKV